MKSKIKFAILISFFALNAMANPEYEKMVREQLVEAHTLEIKNGADFEKYNWVVTPPTYTLATYQTPIKNQSDRRTCWIFAAIGAIEARYKRDFGITLDLSEQYFNHIAKSATLAFPKIYKYENQSSYWGGGGAFVVADAKTYLIPEERFAPYKNQTQMDAIKASIPEAGTLEWAGDPAANPTTQKNVDAFEYSTNHIPSAARLNAKYGVVSYSLYNTDVAANTDRLEQLISTNHEVLVDIDVKWKLNVTTGVYEYDAKADGGGHCVLLIGYDRARQWFLVKNSWGDSGFLKVSYDFIRRVSIYASTVDSVVAPTTGVQEKAKWVGIWNSDHDGWKGKLVVRRLTNTGNVPLRFGSYYAHDGSSHTVNGISIDNNRGIQYFISNETENAPGTLTGQRFEADVYSFNANHAAGTTWYGTAEAGVYLGRAPMNAPYSNVFAVNEWRGNWNMMHDGWNGKLNITGIRPTSLSYELTVNYTDSAGVVHPASGFMRNATPTLATITVRFPAFTQTFTLHYHVWDDGLASGSTMQGGRRYGVHAVRIP